MITPCTSIRCPRNKERRSMTPTRFSGNRFSSTASSDWLSRQKMYRYLRNFFRVVEMVSRVLEYASTIWAVLSRRDNGSDFQVLRSREPSEDIPKEMQKPTDKIEETSSVPGEVISWYTLNSWTQSKRWKWPLNGWGLAGVKLLLRWVER